MPNPLSAELLAAYAALWDFRSNFNNAVKQIEAAYGRPGYQAGEGAQALTRMQTTWDFAVGAATGIDAPMAHNFGAGAYGHSAYAQFEGVLTHAHTAPYETEQSATGPIYRVADVHVRELDQRVAQTYAIYMQAIEPFLSSGDFLPMYDVQQIIPIEPDERPQQDREVNVAYVRHRIRFQVRQAAWPT
jgi:hypothetical protein